jgi:hypothetical protein
MPIIRVKRPEVQEETINSGKNAGKVMRSQMAELDLGNGYGLPFRVGLGSRPAYAPGEYDIDPKCFALSQYGDLTLNRYVDLVPLGVAKSKAA